MALEAGTRLGPYEIASLLGKGGMGEVYRARDTRLGRDVAVKVLPAELSGDETYRKRLEREAKTISQLQHPNVCMLLDIGSEGATQYLVMEYLEGETLEDRLREGALPVDDVLRIGGEIAEAIEAAHRRGIVHRDLKPGNVMLTKTGTKVLDFGLAKGNEVGRVEPDAETETLAQALTREGRLVGTLPYMAPEQLQGSQADSRTDIWGLGCLLYEMATGDRPFEGKSQADLIGAIMGSEPEPLTRKQPLAPERLDWVAKRCLEKDPEKRWQSARDVTIEIESLQKPVSASPLRPLPRRLAAAGLTILVVLVAVAAWRIAVPGRSAESGTGALPELTGFAVLPFENLTGDSELDQIALGLADAIVGTRLASDGEGWKAIPLRSPLAEGQTPCELAASQHVEFLFGGTIRSLSGRLRIGAELVQCPNGDVIWRDIYDRDRGDLAALEEDLGTSIRAAAQNLMMTVRYYENPGSISWHIGRRTQADNARAVEQIREQMQRATRERNEPRQYYLLQLSMEVYIQALLEGWSDPALDWVAELEGVARDCLATRPLGGGCVYLTGFAGIVSGKREAVIQAFQRNLELSGGHSRTHGWLAWALALAGRTGEALEHLSTALRESPDDPDVQAWLNYSSQAHFAGGDYEKARDTALQSVQLSINDPFNQLATAYQHLAVSYAYLGDTEKAQEALVHATDQRPGLSPEWVEIFYSIADHEHRHRYLDGLRMAGLED